MRNLTMNEMRNVEGGFASASVYCPTCHKKYKVRLIDRIMKSNATIRGMLEAYHYGKGVIPRCGYIKH